MNQLLIVAAFAAVPLPLAYGDDDPSVRRSLERIGEIRGNWTAEWEFPEAVRREAATNSASTAAQQMSLSPDPEIRKRAVELLGNETKSPTLKSLLWALGDADPGVREGATTKLNRIPSATLLQEVLDVLVENQEQAVHALDTALPELQPALGDEFLRMYRDPSLPIPLRRAAAYSLGKMRVTAAAGDLAKGAWETETTLAESSARALYALRDTQSVRAWSALRKHPDAAVRWLAITALAELGGSEAFAALAEIAYGAQDFDPNLVSLTIRALAVWPRGDCVPALIEVMKRNSGRKEEAAALLRTRTGQTLGDTVPEWENWYLNGPAPPPDTPDASGGNGNFSAQDLLGHAQFVPPEMSVSF